MSSQGWELAQDGMERAYEHAVYDWKSEAEKAVRQTAVEMDEFTTDDVWVRIPGEFKTHEHRAMGAVIRKAKRDGHIESTGQWRCSSHRTCHGRPKKVWRTKREGV